jgi:ribosomal protein S11
MSAISGINSSLQGIQRGMQGLAKNAATIASKDFMETQGPEGLAKVTVEMIENKTQVQASAKALQIIQETIGTILDIKA